MSHPTAPKPRWSRARRLLTRATANRIGLALLTVTTTAYTLLETAGTNHP
jgi:hypothetical protein